VVISPFSKNPPNYQLQNEKFHLDLSHQPGPRLESKLLIRGMLIYDEKLLVAAWKTSNKQWLSKPTKRLAHW